MRTVKIVPSICKVENAKWSGHVVMRLPSFDEKFELLESLNVKQNGGEVEVDSNQIAMIRKMVAASQKFYVEVSLTDGVETVNSFDDMQYIEDMHQVLAEIAGKMMDGFKVGNG